MYVCVCTFLTHTLHDFLDLVLEVELSIILNLINRNWVKWIKI